MAPGGARRTLAHTRDSSQSSSIIFSSNITRNSYCYNWTQKSGCWRLHRKHSVPLDQSLSNVVSMLFTLSTSNALRAASGRRRATPLSTDVTTHIAHTGDSGRPQALHTCTGSDPALLLTHFATISILLWKYKEKNIALVVHVNAKMT